ncbi:hypothetical protein MNB_ARC-1_1144 [hydrothermal vent metagenome]|uniref:Bacterial repeat domain-containing protein n=1 Tax=hydrothermal vent metagenome TaxID=652676 RepID=A0A3B1E6R4_9ZZZZ
MRKIVIVTIVLAICFQATSLSAAIVNVDLEAKRIKTLRNFVARVKTLADATARTIRATADIDGFKDADKMKKKISAKQHLEDGAWDILLYDDNNPSIGLVYKKDEKQIRFTHALRGATPRQIDRFKSIKFDEIASGALRFDTQNLDFYVNLDKDTVEFLDIVEELRTNPYLFVSDEFPTDINNTRTFFQIRPTGGFNIYKYEGSPLHRTLVVSTEKEGCPIVKDRETLKGTEAYSGACVFVDGDKFRFQKETHSWVPDGNDRISGGIPGVTLSTNSANATSPTTSLGDMVLTYELTIQGMLWRLSSSSFRIGDIVDVGQAYDGEFSGSKRFVGKEYNISGRSIYYFQDSSTIDNPPIAAKTLLDFKAISSSQSLSTLPVGTLGYILGKKYQDVLTMIKKRVSPTLEVFVYYAKDYRDAVKRYINNQMPTIIGEYGKYVFVEESFEIFQIIPNTLTLRSYNNPKKFLVKGTRADAGTVNLNNKTYKYYTMETSDCNTTTCNGASGSFAGKKVQRLFEFQPGRRGVNNLVDIGTTLSLADAYQKGDDVVRIGDKLFTKGKAMDSNRIESIAYHDSSGQYYTSSNKTVSSNYVDANSTVQLPRGYTLQLPGIFNTPNNIGTLPVKKIIDYWNAPANVEVTLQGSGANYPDTKMVHIKRASKDYWSNDNLLINSDTILLTSGTRASFPANIAQDPKLAVSQDIQVPRQLIRIFNSSLVYPDGVIYEQGDGTYAKSYRWVYSSSSSNTEVVNNLVDIPLCNKALTGSQPCYPKPSSPETNLISYTSSGNARSKVLKWITPDHIWCTISTPQQCLIRNMQPDTFDGNTTVAKRAYDKLGSPSKYVDDKNCSLEDDTNCWLPTHRWTRSTVVCDSQLTCYDNNITNSLINGTSGDYNGTSMIWDDNKSLWKKYNSIPIKYLSKSCDPLLWTTDVNMARNGCGKVGSPAIWVDKNSCQMENSDICWDDIRHKWLRGNIVKHCNSQLKYDAAATFCARRGKSIPSQNFVETWNGDKKALVCLNPGGDSRRMWTSNSHIYEYSPHQYLYYLKEDNNIFEIGKGTINGANNNLNMHSIRNVAQYFVCQGNNDPIDDLGICATSATCYDTNVLNRLGPIGNYDTITFNPGGVASVKMIWDADANSGTGLWKRLSDGKYLSKLCSSNQFKNDMEFINKACKIPDPAHYPGRWVKKASSAEPFLECMWGANSGTCWHNQNHVWTSGQLPTCDTSSACYALAFLNSHKNNTIKYDGNKTTLHTGLNVDSHLIYDQLNSLWISNTYSKYLQKCAGTNRFININTPNAVEIAEKGCEKVDNGMAWVDDNGCKITNRDICWLPGVGKWTNETFECNTPWECYNKVGNSGFPNGMQGLYIESKTNGVTASMTWDGAKSLWKNDDTGKYLPKCTTQLDFSLIWVDSNQANEACYNEGRSPTALTNKNHCRLTRSRTCWNNDIGLWTKNGRPFRMVGQCSSSSECYSSSFLGRKTTVQGASNQAKYNGNPYVYMIYDNSRNLWKKDGMEHFLAKQCNINRFFYNAVEAQRACREKGSGRNRYWVGTNRAGHNGNPCRVTGVPNMCWNNARGFWYDRTQISLRVISTGNGRVTGTGSFAPYSNPRIRAIPNSGYEFYRWRTDPQYHCRTANPSNTVDQTHLPWFNAPATCYADFRKIRTSTPTPPPSRPRPNPRPPLLHGWY